MAPEGENLNYFLSVYLHRMALLTIMEQIQSEGVTHSESNNIVARTIQADQIFSSSDTQSWSFRRTSLLSSLALPLVPQLYEDEGNRIISFCF